VARTFGRLRPPNSDQEGQQESRDDGVTKAQFDSRPLCEFRPDPEPGSRYSSETVSSGKLMPD
jgi:hypothetical protein